MRKEMQDKYVQKTIRKSVWFFGGLVRIKVVSWPGFLEKQNLSKGFPQELFGD